MVPPRVIPRSEATGHLSSLDRDARFLATLGMTKHA